MQQSDEKPRASTVTESSRQAEDRQDKVSGGVAGAWPDLPDSGRPCRPAPRRRGRKAPDCAPFVPLPQVAEVPLMIGAGQQEMQGGVVHPCIGSWFREHGPREANQRFAPGRISCSRNAMRQKIKLCPSAAPASMSARPGSRGSRTAESARTTDTSVRSGLAGARKGRRRHCIRRMMMLSTSTQLV